MKRALASLVLLSVASGPSVLVAQSPGPPGDLPPQAAAHVPDVRGPSHRDISPPLRDLPPLSLASTSRFRSKRWARLPRNIRSAARIATDPAVQTSPGTPNTPSTSTNFEGLSSDGQAGSVGVVLPPDTNADVGPNHIVQWVNLTFAVYNKSTGALMYGPAAGNTLWQGVGGACQDSNDGDPIVLYDRLADRWLMSQLAVPNFPDGPFYQCLAVSKTGDPLGQYYRYVFVISDTYLNDYPKFGIWPDGYYMAVNHFYCYDWLPPFGLIACDWAGQGAYAFERDKMLQGLGAQMVGFRLPTSNLGGMLPSHLQGATLPPLGAGNYFVQVDDDAWLQQSDPWGPDADRLQIWEFKPNWADAFTSTFTQVAVLATEPFDSNMCGYQTNCIPQPGVDVIGQPSPGVDALADRLMYRLQYRNFGSYQTLVTNHTVDVNGNDHAGIRWYELRNTGGGWAIQQQSTYAPADGDHRWMASAAMDGSGNIALGFSVSSLTTSPSIRYVGRDAADPPNEMGTEGSIVAGTGYQLHSAGRWGDYASMSVDPTDDCTFWFTTEYYQDVDIWYGANWQTRIASFKFASCGTPLPSLSIDDVTVTEGNGGTKDVVFTVTLSAPSSEQVTVQYATANGTATAGSDYTATSGMLTFTPNQQSQTITVQVNGDATYEANETFFVNLSGATNATIAKAQGVGTITNDDLPTLSINDVAVTEGHSGTVAVNFTVSLLPASNQTVTVAYATASGATSGSATAGSDYAATAGTLSFAPGQTTRTVTVDVLGDTTPEPEEVFYVDLSNPTNATIVDGQGVGTIINDDSPSQASITVKAPNGGETWRINRTRTIQWSSSGVAGAVDVYLSRDAGATWTLLYNDTTNDGAQSWRVTSPATTQARIRVCSGDGSVCDQSNGNFTIK